LGALNDQRENSSRTQQLAADLRASASGIADQAGGGLALIFVASPETETPENTTRLRAAAEAGVLPRDEAAAAVEAFHFIQGLRLRHQHLEGELPRGTENRIDPNRLNDVDRRVLKAAFRQAALLQDRLRADYGL